MPEAAQHAQIPGEEAPRPDRNDSTPELSNGRPVDASVRRMVEPGFGMGLSHVTVHTGADAQALANRERARAITSGSSIAFAAGQYRPGTLHGDALLAHELAHVVQQDGAHDVLPPSSVGVAERGADAAAGAALLRSGRHRGAIEAQTGISPDRVSAPAGAPLRRGLGLALQGCTSEPEWAHARSDAPAPDEVSELRRGGRREQLDWGGGFELDGSQYHGVIDGDGDQSAELDLVFRAGARGQYGAVDRVDVQATRLGNTPDRSGPGTESHTVSFDTTGTAFERGLSPRVFRRTDGYSPTEIRATGSYLHPFAELSIDPPAPQGPQASYRMSMIRRINYGNERSAPEIHTVSFSRDPSDIYPVFVPDMPRRAGPIWVLDARVGIYADPIRFSFRRTGPGGRVTMTLSPMSAGTPIGVTDLQLDVSGQLEVSILRSVGPVLELDLNGDRRPDVRVFERFTPERDWQGGSSREQPDQFRRLTFTITNGDGSQVLKTESRSVERGRWDTDVVHMPTQFESLAAAAAPEAIAHATQIPDLATDLAVTQRMLRELREEAVSGQLVSSAAITSYDQLVDRWLEVARASEDGVPAAAARASAAARSFDARWTTEAAAGRRDRDFAYQGVANPRGWSNEFTGAEHRFVDQGMGLTEYRDQATYAERLAVALDANDRRAASDLMIRLASGVNLWVARRFRLAGREGDDDRARRVGELAHLASELDALADHDPTRATAVFYSAPEYVSQGVPAALPLRLYYWKESGTWYLKDLTNPSNRGSRGVLSMASSAPEPPAELFRLLNDQDRYPKGVIHYELAGDRGRSDTVSITHPWRVSDVLNWISLGLAATALLVGVVASGGTAAAVIVPLLWGTSAVLGAAGAVAHSIEEHRQGRLDGATIALDVATVVASLAGAAGGLNRAVTAWRVAGATRAAAQTGRALTTAQISNLSLFTQRSLNWLLVTEIAGDVTQIVLGTSELIQAIAQIDASGMSDGDKLRAKMMLLAQAGATAGLTFVSVRGNYRQVRAALDRGGSRLVDVGSQTIVPGTYDAAHYRAELDAVLGDRARRGMANEPVRMVPPEQAGSSLGLARIDMVDGRPQLVVIDGAPLSVVREEIVHLEQLALRGRPRSSLTPAEQRIRDAADRVAVARSRWASMSPTDRIRAQQARLDLEEDAQLTLIRHYDQALGSGAGTVHLLDVENAFQNLEAIRTHRARLAGAEAAHRGGSPADQLGVDLDTAPNLYNKATLQSTPVDESWRNLSETDFVLAYRSRYPDTTLSLAELRLRHRMGRRLNPATGRLIDPTARIPDVRASYLDDADERLRLQGDDRVRLDRSEQRRIDELLAERDRARAARDTEPEGSRERHLEQYRMNEASRQLGEHGATLWINRRYPGPPQPHRVYPGTTPGSRPGDFDQVWRCTVVENGQARNVWIVVEAKGGASPLGSRQTREGRAEQGTALYFEDILRVMRDMGGEAADAVRDIRRAQAAQDRIRYVHVTAPIGYTAGTGGAEVSTLGDISVREFDMTPQGAVPVASGTVGGGSVPTAD